MDKIVVLKLGGKCNLKCSHCHSSKVMYEFNPEIIDWIKNNDTTRVTFSGGEPTLYFDLIKKIVAMLPETLEYKLVTNGTKLTYDMVEYFNSHNFRVVISYDGENDSRDRSYLQCWDEYSNVEKQGVSSLFSKENQDINKFTEELEAFRYKFMKHAVGSSIWLNFPHQTDVNSNNTVDLQLAKDYCKTIAVQVESDFIALKNGQRFNLSALGMAFLKWVLIKDASYGVSCFSPDNVTITIDGRFLLCPYGIDYIGDIHSGVDLIKLNSHIPEKCKGCGLWNVCRCSCVANISDNECFVSKVMIKHMRKLMDKYNVSYHALYSVFKENYQDDGIKVCS